MQPVVAATVSSEFATAQSLPLAPHHGEQHGATATATAAAADDVGAVGGEVAGIAVASNAAQYEVILY